MYKLRKTTRTQSWIPASAGTSFTKHWTLTKVPSKTLKKQGFNFSRLIGLSSRKRGTSIWLPAFAGTGSLGGEKGALPATKSNYKGESMTNHTLNTRPNALLKNQTNTKHIGVPMNLLNSIHAKTHKNILQKSKINDTMMEPSNHGEKTSMIKPVFRKPTAADEALIKSWWGTPHVMAFWGNDPSKHFPKLEYVLHGGTNPHNYETEYWLACDGDVPYGLLLTSDMRDGIMADAVHAAYFVHGPTWSVDMLIGPEAYLGRGHAIPTLRAFVQYLQTKGVARLMIDPEVTNVKAIHVYERAGFKTVTTFQPKEGQFAAGRDHYLMVLDLISAGESIS